MKLIEMVCTGNQGRSPVAELVAQNYLRKLGAAVEYAASSSGTLVDQLLKGQVSTGFMKHVIGIARGRDDIYAPGQRQEVDDALGEEKTELLTPLYNQAKDVFIAEERRDRQLVLPEFGIEGSLKEVQEQTIARPEAVAVLSMAEKNNTQVKAIYGGSRLGPVIDVLSSYATGDGSAEIPNAFGLGQKAYREAVEAIVENVPLAVDRLMK